MKIKVKVWCPSLKHVVKVKVSKPGLFNYTETPKSKTEKNMK